MMQVEARVFWALGRARRCIDSGCTAGEYVSRHRFERTAEPGIHSLSRVLGTESPRLSLCSLPVLKQCEEGLGSVISFV